MDVFLNVLGSLQAFYKCSFSDQNDLGLGVLRKDKNKIMTQW